MNPLNDVYARRSTGDNMVNKKIDASSIELWRFYRRQPYLFAQLPEAWKLSIEQNYVEAVQRLRQRRKAIPISIMATFAALTMAKAESATTYTTSITGNASDPQYTTSTDANGNLVYTLASNDAVNVESPNTQVYGVAITSSSTSSVIDATAGGASILATRDVPSSGTIAGGAYGIFVSSPSTAPKSVTINGPVSITAVDHNTRSGGNIYGNAYALWADDFGSITINGDTTLKASTPGYGRVINLSGLGSRITINGNLTAESDSNNTDYAIQGDGRSVLKVTGNVNLTADGVYPSDNVNGIWNPSVSTHTEIGGNLNLYAIAHGSTVMGIRNNGFIYVGGTTSITAVGNRTAFGVNAGHRLSKTEFKGDATISAQGGLAIFGDTTGAYNYGGNGGNGYMRFDGNLVVTATNGTFEGDSDVYGIDNAGNMSLTTARTTAQIKATGTKGSHSAYGIHNSLSLTAASNVAITVSEVAGATYGVLNSGTANFNGGFSVTKASGSTAANHYGVVTRSLGASTATTNINQANSNDVTIQGDVLTGSNSGYAGVLNLNLDTTNSWLNGLVLADTDGSVGQANVSLSNGARWIVTGSGTVATDFGAGRLTVGSGGVIDMAASWGTFSPGSVPSYSLRSLQIGSTSNSGAVTLGDGATFALLSDIRNAQADKVVFGGGITSFTAQGTQDIRIAYDPVLDATSWVNATALQKGVTIAASSPIVIVDASAAAGGTASFLAAAGLTSQWSTTHENALVRFSYVPQVSLSADSRQIVLTGITILGNGSGSTSSSGTSTSTNSTTSTSSATSSTTGTSTGTTMGESSSTGTTATTTTTAPTTTATSGNETAITTAAMSMTPSTGVLVAGDAALAMSNIWQVDEQAVSRRGESLRLGEGSNASGLWVDTDGGRFEGSSSYGRTYRQSATNASVGAERQTDFDGGHNAIGLVYTHTQSNASLQNGKAALRGDSLGAYGSWNSYHGVFADVVARIGQLSNSYSSSDAFGTTHGHYRARAASVSVRAGRRFRGEKGGYIEPQAQVAYGSIGRVGYTASDDVHFDVNANRTFLSRAGVMAGKAFFVTPVTSADVYARVAVVHTVGDRPNITASLDGGSIPVVLPARHATTREAAVGAHVALAGRWSAYAEAGRTSRADVVAGGWRASAGVRVSF
jgi:outer membrane autotransporter protein